MTNNFFGKLCAVAAAASAVAGCGGSGTVGEPSPTPTASGGSITGHAFKGPTRGATVCLYAIDPAAPGGKGAPVVAQAGSSPAIDNGCVVTGGDGQFRFQLPDNASGELLIESTGGTYCSDESVFDGTSCAHGGAPVPMGANALRTVVSAPGSGHTASAPLTVLTTAAVGAAGTLSGAGFNTAYATVASNFGLAGTAANADPTSGALNNMLRGLSRHLGADNRLIASLVDRIADGTLTGGHGEITPVMTVTGRALLSDERRQVMLGSACFTDADGVHQQHVYSMFLPEGRATRGSFTAYHFGDAACDGPTGQFTVGFDVEYLGSVDVPRQATTDVRKAQVGSASVARFSFPIDSRLGARSGVDANFMIARDDDACHSQATAYLSAVGSPVQNGVLSRLDVSQPYTIYCEN
jgi:hypothetical protein